MADPLSITCGVLALVSFALSSTVTLTTTIRSLQGHNKQTLALKRELCDLAAVLESLLETVNANPDINFDALKSPLHRCGNACKEYGDLVARFTKHSAGARTSLRDWVKQKYLQGDVTDFKDMLAGYKSTINIAIANVNIRVAAVTPKALESYRNMMSDTTQELQQHLQDINEKMQALSSRGTEDGGQGDGEWQAILEEKKCTQQGLEICAQLSAKIEQLEPMVEAGGRSSAAPSPACAAEARGYVRTGLGATKASVQAMVAQLRGHEDVIEERFRKMISSNPLSKEMAEELERLQATKDSIHQCIRVVSEANDETAEIERQNVFEDITLADNSYSFTVSTVGDLVTAKRINLTGRSYNVGGQITDDGFQKAIEAFTREGIRPAPVTRQDAPDPKQRPQEANTGSKFQSRHGRGVALKSTTQSLLSSSPSKLGDNEEEDGEEERSRAAGRGRLS